MISRLDIYIEQNFFITTVTISTHIDRMLCTFNITVGVTVWAIRLWNGVVVFLYASAHLRD